jgi:hypothetical protein
MKRGYESIKICEVGHTDAGAWEGWRVSKLLGAAVAYIASSQQLAAENIALSTHWNESILSKQLWRLML